MSFLSTPDHFRTQKQPSCKPITTPSPSSGNNSFRIAPWEHSSMENNSRYTPWNQSFILLEIPGTTPKTQPSLKTHTNSTSETVLVSDPANSIFREYSTVPESFSMSATHRQIPKVAFSPEQKSIQTTSSTPGWPSLGSNNLRPNS